LEAPAVGELELAARVAEIALFPRQEAICHQDSEEQMFAKSNKSRVQGKATNRHARRKNWQNATASMINALEQTRREALLFGAAALVSSLARNVEAGHDTERHGISAFGDLKYPPDFEHFDYVNPNAPKGGGFSHVGAIRIFNQNLLTFNSLNSFILRGDAAMGMELTFASLMVRAEDEPDALYGLAARAVQISPDGLTYRFLMRPGITFHDGSPPSCPASRKN
jgi:hypothetical protein